MLNQVILVGTIKQLPVINRDDSLHYADMKVEVPRLARNSEGEYPVDVFSVTLWRGVADMTLGQYSVGNIVGIKGRLEIDEDTEKARIMAERVSFIQK